MKKLGYVLIALIATTVFGSQILQDLTIKEGTAPATLTGHGKVYVKASDKDLYYKNSSGTEFNVLLGGGSSINNLADVEITNAATSDYLKYDGSYWVNSVFPALVTELGQLNDVSETLLATDDYLKYNGSEWVNATFPTFSSDLEGLTDVDLTTPATDDVLKYDGTKWINSVAPAGVSDLVSLTDVALTSTTTGDYLKFNGINWINYALPNASNSVTGLLTSTDWSTFSNKLSDSASVTHNSVSGLNDGDYTHLSAAEKVIATQASSATLDGYLTSTDWSTFNGKQNDYLTRTGNTLSTTNAGDSIVSTGAITAATFNNVPKDNFLLDGSFEMGINGAGWSCTVGTCTSTTTTPAIGAKALLITTANQTASVTWNGVNANLPYRDIGISCEVKTALTNAQVCAFVNGEQKNCVPVTEGNYTRVPTYVTSDASGNYGFQISTTGTSTGTIEVDDCKVNLDPWNPGTATILVPAEVGMESWTIMQLQNAMTDITSDVRFNLAGTITVRKDGLASTAAALQSTSNLIYAVDSTRTTFYASKNVIVTVAASGTSGGVTYLKIYDSASGTYINGTQTTGASYTVAVAGSFAVLKGATFYLYNVGDLSNTADEFKLEITAIATEATFLAALPVDPPFISYTSTLGQSIPNTGVNLVIFPTMEKDNYGQVTTNGTSTWAFTAKRSGIYLVSAHISYKSEVYVVPTYVDLYLCKNGSVVQALSSVIVQTTSSVAVVETGSTTIYLDAGDTLDVRAYNPRTAGATALSSSAGVSRISITRLGN